MSLTADTIIDRTRLKAQLRNWRLLAIVLAVVAALVLFAKPFQDKTSGGLTATSLKGDYIARVSIDNVIIEDSDRSDILESLKKDNSVKALIVQINSPGGTMAGSEILYNQLRDIASVKPVVAIMGSIAASGGYMTAIAADRIFAQEGTLTGSIGVIFQTAEVTDLADRFGVKFLTYKSSPLKASPSPFEKVTPEVEQAVKSIITDSYDIFVDMVQARRKIDRETLLTLADGRVYTGRQALKAQLIDAIGSEKQALKWLHNKRQIKDSLPVKHVKLTREPETLLELLKGMAGIDKVSIAPFTTTGVMALWSPAISVSQ